MSIAKSLRSNFYAPRTTAQHVDELRRRAAEGAGGGGELRNLPMSCVAYEFGS